MTTITDDEVRKLNERQTRRLARRIALVHLKALRKAYADYEEDVRDWYARGDGRSPNWRTEIDEETGEVYQWNAGGKGYTYPECIHGASRWTDYDNICGPCEDGYSIHELALIRGHANAREFLRRSDVMGTAFRAEAPNEIVNALTDWAFEALPTEFRKHTPATVRNLP